MKILYIHQYFKMPNESGGTRSYDLATGFVKAGHKVEIVTMTSDIRLKGKNRWNKLERNDLTIHYLFMPYKNDFSYIKRSIIFVKFLILATVKTLSLKVDCVLATSTPLTIGIPALIKKGFHRTPYIFEVRDVWPEAVIAVGAIKNRYLQKLLFWLEKTIYEYSNAIIPLSTDMEHSIMRRFPFTANKEVIVIENISKIDRFQLSTDEDLNFIENKIGRKPKFSILYAGTFGKVNGIDYVLTLATLTKQIEPDLVFILIGDGAEKDKIRERASKAGLLNSNVFIFDSISKQELPQWYHFVDMGSSFVIPIKELWANSANKFFDTLAAKKPILINYGGWQSKVINEQNIGYVLPVSIDLNAAVDFVNYINNCNLHKIQSENALNLARNNYSLEIALKKYLLIINNIK